MDDDAKIKIDIVSDVVCPWCVVGYKRLEAAITELGLENKTAIEWKPFELNPLMPAEGENLRDHILRKYGATREQSDRSRSEISAFGAQYDFKFDFFDEMKIVNTRDAHMLLDFSRDHGVQHELAQLLFKAYFSDHKDVSDRKVLLEEASSLGLDSKSAVSVMDDKERRRNLLEKEVMLQNMGISGVPTIFLNGKNPMTGAHPEENYKLALLKLSEA